MGETKIDCPGGWTGGPNGPIEPPCCSWNGDEEIYEGMYQERDYSPRELKWLQEEYDRKEAEKRETEHRARIEHLKEMVFGISCAMTGGVLAATDGAECGIRTLMVEL